MPWSFPYTPDAYLRLVKAIDYTPHLSEVMPGQGFLDYPVFLRELAKYPGVPLMMEHLQTDAECRQAASYIRSVEKNRK
jgi:hypothetical protein